jgi:hypothetical protein
MKMNRNSFLPMFIGLALFAAVPAWAQDVLPFPTPPMGGKVGPTRQESVHKWRETPSHLPEDAPNILIVMLDDAGFGQASTFGGEIATPTLSRLAEDGIAYNRFHTVAQCSPTRAALMTGRNHNRVGSGTIAEFANDWDGYTGVIPKSSATIAEVLRDYGYATAAFGKDHNTQWTSWPTVPTTALRRVEALTISTDLWLVRPRSGNPLCGRTRTRSRRRTWRTTRTST